VRVAHSAQSPHPSPEVGFVSSLTTSSLHSTSAAGERRAPRGGSRDPRCEPSGTGLDWSNTRYIARHEPTRPSRRLITPRPALPSRSRWGLSTRKSSPRTDSPTASWNRRCHANDSRARRPCHPRATCSGHQRYRADNHGHFGDGRLAGRWRLTWNTETARNCMACKGSCRRWIGQRL
jgi:hypothetical protein